MQICYEAREIFLDKFISVYLYFEDVFKFEWYTRLLILTIVFTVLINAILMGQT